MEATRGILEQYRTAPGAGLEVRGHTVELRIQGRLIAECDDRELRVHAPLDVLRQLGQFFAPGRVRGEALVFDMTDSAQRSVAVRALRRRVRVEMLAWQYRAASP